MRPNPTDEMGQFGLRMKLPPRGDPSSSQIQSLGPQAMSAVTPHSESLASPAS